jgi:hypothetical protein
MFIFKFFKGRQIITEAAREGRFLRTIWIRKHSIIPCQINVNIYTKDESNVLKSTA